MVTQMGRRCLMRAEGFPCFWKASFFRGGPSQTLESHFAAERQHGWNIGPVRAPLSAAGWIAAGRIALGPRKSFRALAGVRGVSCQSKKVCRAGAAAARIFLRSRGRFGRAFFAASRRSAASEDSACRSAPPLSGSFQIILRLVHPLLTKPVHSGLFRLDLALVSGGFEHGVGVTGSDHGRKPGTEVFALQLEFRLKWPSFLRRR